VEQWTEERIEQQLGVRKNEQGPERNEKLATWGRTAASFRSIYRRKRQSDPARGMPTYGDRAARSWESWERGNRLPFSLPFL